MFHRIWFLILVIGWGVGVPKSMNNKSRISDLGLW